MIKIDWKFITSLRYPKFVTQTSELVKTINLMLAFHYFSEVYSECLLFKQIDLNEN